MGEKYLDAVYQAAIGRNGDGQISTRNLRRVRDNLVRRQSQGSYAPSKTLDGTIGHLREVARRTPRKDPASIRGILNLMAKARPCTS